MTNTRAMSVAVAERAAEQQQRRQRHEIGVDDPLQARRPTVPRSSLIEGSATLTTVPSRNAMPDPSTVAAIVQRAVAVPYRTRAGAATVIGVRLG